MRVIVTRLQASNRAHKGGIHESVRAGCAVHPLRGNGLETRAGSGHLALHGAIQFTGNGLKFIERADEFLQAGIFDGCLAHVAQGLEQNANLTQIGTHAVRTDWENR